MVEKLEKGLCENGDGKGVYAKGFCFNCYRKDARAQKREFERDFKDSDDSNPWSKAKSKEPLEKAPRVKEIDEIESSFVKRGPRQMPGVDEKEDDTNGMKKARQHLREKTVIYRRRIVRSMIGQGYLEEDVLNEFLENEQLVALFTKNLADPLRTIHSDIVAIKNGNDQWTGRAVVNAQDQYIEGLERSLRLASRYAEDMTLAAKDRVHWAKLIPDLHEKLAILKRVVHMVPGRGMVPVGAGGSIDDDDWEDDEDEVSIPNVRFPEDDDED